MATEDGTSGWLRDQFNRLSWFQKSLLTGAILTILWTNTVSGDLERRVLVDSVLLIGGPLALAVTHRRHIGWTINRVAVRNAVLLSMFVLPFYLIGSTLPTIREFYPMWHTTVAPETFLPHAVQLFVLAVAAETYYRGLLCVGVKEIGFKAVLISPIVYMIHHSTKPPIEFLLSGPTDVLFGAVDYKSNSILPSVIAHGAGLVLLDWLVLHDPLFDPMPFLSALEWLPIPL
ncbi:CPBP family glutamic-type intramembrane protease [Natrarchaeobaculum sulfurireducens]|uniref:Metal-dependent membrane protease, CAAX family n=1 Tax=Natrarchaeobaculum sulfurireducens TaxID=2044521 RepID=A0A346PM75_9EURY|nr:CPBP family glutamic-type intramembrane protease [Natrarchaeobaculum sulfurireducens]AXR76953.1 Metal-dependent membrane protease, CAAX family [Natrarchaeobaculum sulfurireducens]AXR80620.1 Metal-dependent membrane protease, CAAX family [Natrarchaeobaculum sulfurireducens]